jgi:hypothetical protein
MPENLPPELIETLALAAGLAWASGIRLYAVLFFVGLLGRFGYVELPGGLDLLTHPAVLAASGLAFLIEFGADKVPGLDSLWDALHTFIRIPAGALLAAAAVGQQDPAVALAAAVLGGTLASGAHFTKAASRALINTSPEPVSNVAASSTEDAMVVGGLWLALFHPLAFLGVLAVFIAATLWLLPKLWRGLRRVFMRVSGLLRAGNSAPRPQ